jgi:hypothetical protein
VVGSSFPKGHPHKCRDQYGELPKFSAENLDDRNCLLKPSPWMSTARAVLSTADEDTHNVRVLRRAALQRMAMTTGVMGAR